MNNIKWDIAKGSKVKIDDKWYIDFTSSIFSQNFGHSNYYVIREVRRQLKKCSHAYGYNTDIREKYLEALKAKTGYENILLFSTGAEAIEASIKIALNNGYSCIGVRGSMHGRTLGAEALVGKRVINKINTTELICNSFFYKNNAIFVEGYRGYDCKQLNDDDFNNLILAQNNGNIIIFDEIQSGFYRTNKMFVCDTKIIPDILVIGKSMGGGFPLSAVCWNKDFNLNGIELTSTHSGQPLQMAAGYGVLNYINNHFDFRKYNENVEIMNRFFNNLRRYYKNYSFNNKGMVGAICFGSEDFIYNYCFNNGLLVTKTGKGWIKIAPPINISKKLFYKGLSILEGLF